jgi:hypothetical protein
MKPFAFVSVGVMLLFIGSHQLAGQEPDASKLPLGAKAWELMVRIHKILQVHGLRSLFSD